MSPPPCETASPSRRTTWLTCALIVAIAAVLRLIPATGDFWLDEIWTWFTVRRLDSAVDVFTRIHHSNNNHLNSLLFFWIGERSDWVVYRIPSLAAGIGGVALAAVLAGRRGNLEAILAALLTGGCFALIHFSSEARGYSLAVFFALATTWTLRKHLERPRIRTAVLFGICVILGFLAHLVFLFHWAGAAAQSARRWLRTPEDRLRGLARWLLLHAAPFAAFLWLYQTDLRLLSVGGGNPTEWPSLFARTVGFSLGLPVIPELALPYLLGVAAIAFAGLRLMQREGDDEWLAMLVTIFVAPLLVIATMRPEVVAVRYFLIGIALFLLIGSRLLASLWRAGGWRRSTAIAATSLFLVGNAAHLVPFLQHGRGGYRDALLFMAEHSPEGRIRVGSDHDFRIGQVLRFYEASLPETVTLIYQTRENRPRSGPDWLIRHAGRRPELPLEEIRDEHGNRYRLAREFDHGAISGFYWAVYRKLAEPEGSSARRRMTIPKPRP